MRNRRSSLPKVGSDDPRAVHGEPVRSAQECIGVHETIFSPPVTPSIIQCNTPNICSIQLTLTAQGFRANCNAGPTFALRWGCAWERTHPEHANESMYVHAYGCRRGLHNPRREQWSPSLPPTLTFLVNQSDLRV